MSKKVGDRCQVELGERRGNVKFVGQAKTLAPGFWVGVQYDEPVGKHDGINAVWITDKNLKCFRIEFDKQNNKNSGNYNNPKNTSNDADEQPNKNQKNDKRRKALVVEEKSGEKNDESCTFTSSSESDSSEDEKGLLCLFS
nr:tubulin-folding cofactor B-like [Ipomoea batatas]